MLIFHYFEIGGSQGVDEIAIEGRIWPTGEVVDVCGNFIKKFNTSQWNFKKYK